MPTSSYTSNQVSCSKLQVVDLFAGAGGLSLGAARAGFHLALAVDSDKHAIFVHQKNFPKFKHSSSDISELTGIQLMKDAGLKSGDLDGLIGGPPCQGFSTMGMRKVVDPRNGLFSKFFELVSQCRPRFFLAENVPGILNEQYKDIRDNAFRLVQDDYTLLPYMKLKACDFGAPTTRERVFFIGYLKDELLSLQPEDFEKVKTRTPPKVADALKGLLTNICSDWLTEEKSWRLVEELPDSTFWQRIHGEIPEGVGDLEAIERYKNEKLVSGCFGTRHTGDVLERYEKLKPGEKDSTSRAMRLDPNGLCPTLRAGTGPDRGSYQAVRPIHPTQPRVITPREAARLQGFPDWFQFSPTKWHSFRQIGNSVSPILAEAILNVIHKRLQESTNLSKP
jgi:DNA (cytosine-5)-methyltransferase 1